MKRTVVLFLSLVGFTACQTTPGDPSGSGGSGGTLASGGAGSGGAPVGGYNNPDGTLHTLECKPAGPMTQWTVREVTCSVFPDHIEMYVGSEGNDWYGLLHVVVEGLEPGVHLTEYGGEATSVRTGECLGPTSAASPDPCEVELMVIERGEPAAGGAGGTTLETGSRVRLRVSCPDGLYVPPSDDVGASPRDLVPAEFELEAHDCSVMGN
jgi:hypothetical protein